MSLDLGSVIATATIDIVPLQRGVREAVRIVSGLGERAAKASNGVRVLDDSLVATGDSATKASTSIDRATKATTAAGASAEKAAAKERQHAAAVSRTSAVMAEYASESTRVQQAALRLAAAEDRLDAVQRSNTATTRQLASAQATLIGAQRSLTAAQEAGAVAGGRFRASMAGTLKTAGELGLLVGAFEAVKKAIDIGKQAGDFQRQMLLIKTQTGGTTAEVNYMSKAILNLAGKVATSPDSLATSVYHFESIGLRGAAALHAMTIAAEGAKVGNSNLDDTTQALVYTVQSGITGVKGLSQAMGVFNTIVGSGDMTTQQLVEALGSHGLLANAKASGVSIQELGAALAVLGDNGVKGVNAATGITQILNDLLKPAAGGAAALDAIGLSSDELRNTLSGKGLDAALQKLSAHLTAAGITGTKLKGALADMFTKRASANLAIVLGNMDLWNRKLAINTKAASGFDKAWQDTTKNASFAWQRISAKVDAAGIALATKLLPPSAEAARWLGTNIPHALSVLANILGPTVHLVGDGLGGAWHVATAAMSAAAAVLGPIVHFLEEHETLTTGVATGVLSMWAAWKLWTIARAAIMGIGNGLSWLGTRMAATAIVPATITKAVDSAAASTQLAAVSMGASWTSVAAKSEASAAAAGAAAVKMAGAADTAAVGVAGAGEAAAVGWTAMLGPLAGIGLGIGLLVSMFHRSASASQEATAAAKAYTDALSGSGGKTTIIDTITQQLKDNDVPQTIDELNKALGSTQFTGQEFAKAIESQGQPLVELRARLQAVVTAGKSMNENIARGAAQLTPAYIRWKTATKLLGDLNTQADVLSKTAQKDLADTKAFAGVSSSIDKVSASTQIGSDLAKQYAQMMGIVVDENGVAAVSAKTLNTAVNTVSSAYAHATTTGSEFLATLVNFSKSAGTAADRAALIGATLKAANGDALAYAAGMNAATVADHQLVKDLQGAAAQVGKHGETIKALTASIVNLKTGTIDYSKDAATPLINDLQSMQTAAMNAAEATFQHARATMSGTAAADAAYKVYKAQTSGALIDEATKLGLTAAQAKRLSDEYFGMPPDVKTTIRAEGADPVVRVLNKIGRLLAFITGTDWNASIHVSTVFDSANTARRAAQAGFNPNAPGNASGGGLPRGWSAVGERGAELVYNSGRSAHVFSNSQSKAIIARTGMRAPGFAGGTDPTPGQLLGTGRHILGGFRHLGGLLGHSDSSRSDFASQLGDIYSMLRDAGVPRSFILGLKHDNGQILDAVGVRDKAARRLAAANQALHDARKVLRTDERTFKGAVVGSFDITTAGTNPVTGKITGGSLLAQQAQAVTRARAFVTGIKKLMDKLPGPYVRELAGKGPDALPEVNALLGLSTSQMRTLRHENRQLNKLGEQIGTAAGRHLDQGDINQARHVVHERRQAEQRAQQHLEKLTHEQTVAIVDALHTLHLEGKLALTAGQLALIVDTGASQNAKARRQPVPRNSGR